MKLTRHEAEAVEYLREWAAEGFPRRVDGSFPTDFLTAMRRLMDVPAEKMDTRRFERALSAGREFDVRLPDNWSWDDTRRAKKLLR